MVQYLAETSFGHFFHTNIVNWLGIKLNIKLVLDHCMIHDGIIIGLQPRRFYKENIMVMCYSIREELQDSELFQLAEVLGRAYSSITAT